MDLHARKRLAFALATAMIAVAAGTGAGVAAVQAATSRSIAVGVPTDPVLVRPGEASELPIRVINPGATAVTVMVKGEGIRLGNDGHVALTGRPDPEWSTRASFPAGELTIQPQSYVNVTVTVHVPAHLPPNLYFIGFVVTPVASGSGVVQINQIASFVTINLAGPRTRSLTATVEGPQGWHIGTFVLGSKVTGTLVVRNTGRTAVQFWGENNVTSLFRSDPVEQRIPVSLVPAGRYREFRLSGAGWLPVDIVTLGVSVTYPGRTAVSTRQILITRSYWVVAPWAILAFLVLVALLAAWWALPHRQHSRSTSRGRVGRPATDRLWVKSRSRW